jgi:hypothetical protein
MDKVREAILRILLIKGVTALETQTEAHTEVQISQTGKNF